MKTEIQPSVCRVGKMQKWHKLITFLGVVLSLVSGVTWFIASDLLDKPISDIRFWMYFHGISGHLFLLILGMAFYHHVQVCWKMKKNGTAAGFPSGQRLNDPVRRAGAVRRVAMRSFAP